MFFCLWSFCEKLQEFWQGSLNWPAIRGNLPFLGGGLFQLKKNTQKPEKDDEFPVREVWGGLHRWCIAQQGVSRDHKNASYLFLRLWKKRPKRGDDHMGPTKLTGSWEENHRLKSDFWWDMWAFSGSWTSLVLVTGEPQDKIAMAEKLVAATSAQTTAKSCFNI